MATKVLFILKKREMTSEEDNILNREHRANFSYCISSGLRNSASFVCDMLNDNGIESKLVEVVDNNCIDREVTLFKPTHVIIEAFWVVPNKFEILTKLHPTVKWIVRNHSEMPFLANEGIAIDWSLKYMQHRDLYLAPNADRAHRDTKKLVSAAHGTYASEYRVVYLPNFYKVKQDFVTRKPIGDTINIGCFGAIRPFKNHLIQAIAAINFAQKRKKALNFHINVARIEDAGNNVLRSLRGTFANLDPSKYKLVEHGWLNHDDFLELVGTMDIGLQASFTESFNIVAADFVSKGVPIVTSSEISWLPSYFHVDHTDSQSIVDRMEKILYGFDFWKKASYALYGLNRYNEESKKIWLNYFK